MANAAFGVYPSKCLTDSQGGGMRQPASKKHVQNKAHSPLKNQESRIIKNQEFDCSLMDSPFRILSFNASKIRAIGHQPRGQCLTAKRSLLLYFHLIRNFLPQVYSIFRVFKTLFEMLHDRGYLVTSEDLQLTVERFKQEKCMQNFFVAKLRPNFLTREPWCAQVGF